MVECLFSAMTYILMLRKDETVYHIFFEKEIVRNIDFDEFIQEWFKNPRQGPHHTREAMAPKKHYFIFIYHIYGCKKR